MKHRSIVIIMYKAALAKAQRYLTGEMLVDEYDENDAFQEIGAFKEGDSPRTVYERIPPHLLPQFLPKNYDDLSKFWKQFIDLRIELLNFFQKLLEKEFEEYK